MYKTSLRSFLCNNPFPQPLTLGFFYREKMRAIHHIAPDSPFEEILEVGGGRSGLTALLYPKANITNLDLNIEYARVPCNQGKRVHFVIGNCTDLPFENCSFHAVTMFDVLEHVPDHGKAVSEALRVLRPEGFLLVSSPNEKWRFPYHTLMKSICPAEAEMFEEWGHVRRGYSVNELKNLIALPCRTYATFISPLTVLCHDISFSRLSQPLRWAYLRWYQPVDMVGLYSARA